MLLLNSGTLCVYLIQYLLDLIYLPTYQYNEIKLSMKQFCMNYEYCPFNCTFKNVNKKQTDAFENKTKTVN